MKAFVTLLLMSILLLSATSFAGDQPAQPNIYAFKVQGIDGSMIDFAKFKGKKILIVNTASRCGYTPQYEALEALYKAYKGKLVIVGFPANNFGAQEPGTNEEIVAFCKKNYGVSFPMAAKISVKGTDQAAIYKWLTQKALNGYQDSEVKWNFQKYLIDEKGHLVAIFMSDVTPDSPALSAALAR
jgi:glutathione peroxidase